MRLLLVLLMMFSAGALHATPARHMEISYSAEDKKLSIKANHVSRELDEHYIRRMIITVNDKQVDKLNFTRQSAPSQFNHEIDLELEHEDEVQVAIYCSEGGSAKKSLTVKIEEEAESDPEKDKDEFIILKDPKASERHQDYYGAPAPEKNTP